VRKNYLEPLMRVVNAGFSTIEDEENKVNEQKEEVVKENMMVELKKRRHSLRMVEFILQDVISL
jgi:hypothetical protein